ncbi:MAG: HPr family phosphocarrier protein [Spirochaetaceae bacterium]|jgi:phosphotransferase system HPr (HPr) family protein|nr:HPr family phosphocarrier protein [Spirochaetaceae bacterium]
MRELEHTINDPDGIHARPAGLFVKEMQKFTSRITVHRGEDEGVDGKKLISLMKLRLKCGQTFTVKAEGADEDAAIEAARVFLTSNL